MRALYRAFNLNNASSEERQAKNLSAH